MQNFWEKKKGYIFFISTIFHISEKYSILVLPAWANVSAYFDTTVQKTFRHTFIIDFNGRSYL